MKNNLPVPISKYYDIYVNKYGVDTPVNYHGVVEVIGEIDDVLIDT